MPIPKALQARYEQIRVANSQLTFKLSLMSGVEKTLSQGRVGGSPSEKLIMNRAATSLKDIIEKYEKDEKDDNKNQFLNEEDRRNKDETRQKNLKEAIKKWEEQFEKKAKEQIAQWEAPVVNPNSDAGVLKAMQQQVIKQLTTVDIKIIPAITELLLNVIYFENLSKTDLKTKNLLNEVETLVSKLNAKPLQDRNIMIAASFAMENFPNTKDPLITKLLNEIVTIKNADEIYQVQTKILALIEKSLRQTNAPRTSQVRASVVGAGLDEKQDSTMARSSVPNLSVSPTVSLKTKDEYAAMVGEAESFLKKHKSKAHPLPEVNLSPMTNLLSQGKLPDFVTSKQLRTLLKSAKADPSIAKKLNSILDNEKNRQIFMDRIFSGAEEPRNKKAIDLIFDTKIINLKNSVYSYLSKFADKKNLATYAATKAKNEFDVWATLDKIYVDSPGGADPYKKLETFKSNQIKSENPTYPATKIAELAKLSNVEKEVVYAYSMGGIANISVGSLLKSNKLPDFVTQNALMNACLASSSVMAPICLSNPAILERILFGGPTDNLHQKLASRREGIDFVNKFLTICDNNIQISLQANRFGGVGNPRASINIQEKNVIRLNDAIMLGGTFAIKSNNREFLIKNFSAFVNNLSDPSQIQDKGYATLTQKFAEKWFNTVTQPDMPNSIKPSDLITFYKKYGSSNNNFLSNPNVIKVMIQSEKQLQELLEVAKTKQPEQYKEFLKTLKDELQKYQSNPDTSIFKNLDENSVVAINALLTKHNHGLDTIRPPLPSTAAPQIPPQMPELDAATLAWHAAELAAHKPKVADTVSAPTIDAPLVFDLQPAVMLEAETVTPVPLTVAPVAVNVQDKEMTAIRPSITVGGRSS